MKMNKGVADDKSYKDQYHFTEKTFMNGDARRDLPSLNVDPVINSSIKANPFRSNVEVEKDEVILKPDLSALFKAQGKTHKQGGIDVLLEPDSFIFSDDKSLAFTKADHKMFEFKEGGTYKAAKNTPADVLKRNIDVKHYNTLISNITDIKKDDLAKKSSTMMLEKYIDTLGHIAFLQEQKKDFPTGIPPFTSPAPVYNSDVKQDVMSQKQYAKYGGPVNNPFRQLGGSALGLFTNLKPSNRCPCGTNPDGTCVECTDSSVALPLYDRAKVVQSIPGDHQQIYNNNGSLLGVQSKDGKGKITNFMSNADWTKYLANESAQRKYNRQAGYSTEDYVKTLPEYHPPTLTTPGKPNIRITPSYPEEQYPGITPNTPNGPRQPGRDINWQFNPYQLESQAYNASKIATLNRYMPYRSQINPSYADPSLVNPEQTINDAQASTNTSISALNTLNPILRNAQAQSYAGNLLDKMPGIRSQYDNQNAGIQNQFKQGNNQIANGARSQNTQFDQQYYQQSITGLQNYDNARSFLSDKFMSDRMADVQENQSLAYNLASLKNPAYGYNFRNGNFYRNPKDVRDTDPGTQGDYNDLLREINNISDPTERIKQRIQLEKVRKFGSSNSFAKKGGRVNPFR